MQKFSQKSLDELATCDRRLQVIMDEAIQHIDVAVICGNRGEEAQNKAFADGKTKLKWPESKHNSKPSKAMDVVPNPVDWNDLKRFIYMAGIIMGIAACKGIKLRWGGDWNSNDLLSDEKFPDLAHFELVE
jgi:hypothetical protein